MSCHNSGQHWQRDNKKKSDKIIKQIQLAAKFVGILETQ